MYDWLIVGAGFAGATLAERIASHREESVLVIDRRDHIGGNAYDHVNEYGILVHKYGPHIFHTNSDSVANYLSQFTAWRPYKHRVLAFVDGKLVPLPINRTTVNKLYDLELKTDAEVQAFYDSRAEHVGQPQNSEQVIVSQVGRDLYEKFFQTYTRKQWGLDPSELDKSVTSRIPVRTNTDDRYFTDTFQNMPGDGYTRMFERMLDHPLIDLRLNTDFRGVKKSTKFKRLIFTGPIDEYFDYRYGKLPYRSLRFEHKTIHQQEFQASATVNYPQSEQFTRITEYKKLTGQEHPFTSITYEYPSSDGDPFYPIPRPENAALFGKYDALARRQKNVWFVGRLANYRYYNMDQVVGQALKTFSVIDAALGKAKAGCSSAPMAMRNHDV
jgi:UDP-galactopyranose mutase